MEEHRGDGPTLREATEHVRSDVAELRNAAARQREELLGWFHSFIEEHPFRAVGAALGVGYVLSGALVSRTTMRIAAFGTRFYLGRLLKERMADMAVAGLGGNQGAPAPRAE